MSHEEFPLHRALSSAATEKAKEEDEPGKVLLEKGSVATHLQSLQARAARKTEDPQIIKLVSRLKRNQEKTTHIPSEFLCNRTVNVTYYQSRLIQIRVETLWIKQIFTEPPKLDMLFLEVSSSVFQYISNFWEKIVQFTLWSAIKLTVPMIWTIATSLNCERDQKRLIVPIRVPLLLVWWNHNLFKH